MGQTATRENSGAIGVAAALVLLLLGGFFYFPGHTYLHSDTQIYMPILDRLADPALYRNDPVALRPHVSYTIYDEAALILRRATGLEFSQALQLQQLIYRFAGLAGAFLLGRACGLAAPWAVLFASFFGLGATIVGPAVLVAEYEPVPRGYAVPLLMLGIGLAAQERWLWAGVAVGWAILYHPPTTVPVLVVGAIAMWLTRKPGDGRWRAVLPIAGAMAVAFLLSKLQGGHSEPQRFFSTISPALEQLQRLRGSYNFISIWFGRWAWHWLFVLALAAFAWWRLRDLPRFVVMLVAGLIAYGVLMAPLSYLLLEKAKWSLMPQFQPLRALLFMTLFAMLGAALNGIRQRGWASVLWFTAAFGLSGQLDLWLLPWQALSDPVSRMRLLVFLGLAAVAYASIRFYKPLLIAALALPFYLIPEVGKVRNYPVLDHPEIHALADWARSNTGADAVFQFPDAGQALYPGLFRVYAKRAVYVDWKVGGQVNLLEEFATEWWKRWQAAGAPDPVDPAKLAELGIDFVVVQPKNALTSREPDYRNAKYLAYKCGAGNFARERTFQRVPRRLNGGGSH